MENRKGRHRPPPIQIPPLETMDGVRTFAVREGHVDTYHDRQMRSNAFYQQTYWAKHGKPLDQKSPEKSVTNQQDSSLNQPPMKDTANLRTAMSQFMDSEETLSSARDIVRSKSPQKGSKLARREELVEPHFEPTARAAIEARHEERLNALLGLPTEPENDNLLGATIVRQDLRHLAPNARSDEPETTSRSDKKLSLNLKSPKKAFLEFIGSLKPSAADPIPQLPANVPPKAEKLLSSPSRKHRFRSIKIEQSATSKSLPKVSVKSQSEKDMTKPSAFSGFSSRFQSRNDVKKQPRQPTTTNGRYGPDRHPHTSHSSSRQSVGHSAAEQSFGRTASQQSADHAALRQAAIDATRQRAEEMLANKKLPATPPQERSVSSRSTANSIINMYDPVPAIILPRPPTRSKSAGSDVTAVAPKFCPPQATEYRGIVNAGTRLFSQYAATEEGTNHSVPEMSQPNKDYAAVLALTALAGRWREGQVDDRSLRRKTVDLPKTFYSPSNYSLDTVDRDAGFKPSKNVDPNRYILASPSRPAPNPANHGRLISQGTIHMTFQGDPRDITPDNTLDAKIGNPIAVAANAGGIRPKLQHHTPTLRQLEAPQARSSPEISHAFKMTIHHFEGEARPSTGSTTRDISRSGEEQRVIRRRPGSSDIKDLADWDSIKDSHLSVFVPQHPSALPSPLYGNAHGAMAGLNLSDPPIKAQLSSTSPIHNQARPQTRHGDGSPTLGRYNTAAPGHNGSLARPFMSPPPEEPFASPTSVQATLSPHTPGAFPEALHDASHVVTHFAVVNHHMDTLHCGVINSINNLQENLDNSGEARQNALIKELDARLPTTLMRTFERESGRMAGLREAAEPKLDELLALVKEGVVLSLGKITEETVGSKAEAKSIHQKLDKQQKTLDAILAQLKQMGTAIHSNNRTQSSHSARRSQDHQRVPPSGLNHSNQDSVRGHRTAHQYGSEFGIARSESNITLQCEHPGHVEGAFYAQYPAQLGQYGGVYVQDGAPPTGPTTYDGSANFPYAYDPRYRQT